MMICVTALLTALAALGADRLKVDCTSTGDLNVTIGGETVLTAGLTCNGPQWRHAGQEQAHQVSQPEPGRFHGRFRMPQGNAGDLIFDERVRQSGGRATVDYEVTFERDNEIKSQSVMLVLPVGRFGGRRITFYPSETTIALPRETVGARSEHYGWAAAAELGDDRVLLMHTEQPTMLSLMDFRQWGGSDAFGLNVRMVGEVEVAAGAKTRRRLAFQVASAAEARRLSARWRLDFDRTRPSVLLDANGRLWMRDRQRDYATAGVEVHGIHWAFSAQDDMVGWSESHAADATKGRNESRTVAGTIPVKGPGGTSLRFWQRADDEGGSLRLEYRLEFPRDSRLNAYQVTWSLWTDTFAGQQIILTEPLPCTTTASTPVRAPRTQAATSQRSLVIGSDPPQKPEIGTFTAHRAVVAPDHPLGFSLAFDQPTELRIEDRRAEDSQTYQLHVQFARDPNGMRIEAGTRAARTITLHPNRRHQVVLHDGASAHRTDTSDWVPFTLPWDTTAIDLSFLNDGPAGRHGFLQARDGEFVFADGIAARFWGTCFTAEQNLPPHRDAGITARRLARYGVNMVRIHQADAGYASNNLFRSNRRHSRTRALDPSMMDRLDYLIFQLKRNGIYVYFDLLSTRMFDESDGVASAEKLALGGKPYTNFDEHLIDLQEEFAVRFLTHVNPYTALAYKDDPAVAMIALANENDVFSREIKIEPYRTRFERRFRDWAAERYITLPESTIDLRHNTPPLMRFMVEVQRAYNERMMAYLRSIGVKCPVTGSNWTANAGLVAATVPVDFTDSHAYWDHCWDNWTRIRNKVMVRSRRTVFGHLAFQRVPDKPFFCSEWGQPWPNEFRAEMPLAVAAVSAFQGWGGALIYTYAHYSDPDVDCLSGPFDTLNDPCLFGLFYHAALMVRRPDVMPARERLAVQIPDEKTYAEKPASPARCAAYDVAAEHSILATTLGNQIPATRTAPTRKRPPVPRPSGSGHSSRTWHMSAGWAAQPCSKSILNPTAHRVTSDTGQYSRDWERGIAAIDTPRTQAAWGFLGTQDEPLHLSDVEMRIRTGFATVAVSSLTDEPIRHSRRLLLTAVSRAENTGMVYDLFHTRKIAAGRGPILIEPVCGAVSIRTARTDLKVQALSPTGAPVGSVSAELRNGRLRFEIGPSARTMVYLIQP